MDISDLEIFRCVVETGGITRAAERLHRVPSNVTTRVRQLEENLGVKLFLREGKRLRLSPAGEVLLGYANRILALAQEARESVGDNANSGLLRLGAMESTAALRLPKPLADYHRSYPSVTLELRTGSTRQLVAQVLCGELDAALVADPGADKRLEKVGVYKEELVIVADATHPAIRSPQDVSRLTLLAFATGCAYRRRLEDWLDAGAKQADQIMELASYHAILGCAVAGMGIALVPRSILEAFPGRAQLSIHPLAAKYSRSQTVLVWRKGAKSKKLDTLTSFLQDGMYSLATTLACTR